MARRSKMEICIDILRVVSEGNLKPTHVVYKANVSWPRLMKHLGFLQSQGLLATTSAEPWGERYFITEKGIEVLNYYRKIECAMPSEAFAPPE